MPTSLVITSRYGPAHRTRDDGNTKCGATGPAFAVTDNQVRAHRIAICAACDTTGPRTRVPAA